MGLRKSLVGLLSLLHVCYIYEVAARAQRTLPVPTTNMIEVFVWSGPDVFRFHRQRLNLDRADTEAFLRVWEKAMIRDADLIFRTIASTDVRLFYVGGGGDSDLAVPWYASNTNEVYMREAAVADVGAFLQSQSAILPAYDHAVVLTRKDLADDLMGTNSETIAYSNGDTICTFTDGSSAGLAEVSSPNFIKAIAQSILLGFRISYEADTTSYNVMSRNYDTSVNAANRAARWELDATRQTILADRIISDGACLANTVPVLDFLEFLATPPYGATYNLDAQCSNLYGNSTACEVRAARVCFDGMTCTTTGTTSCDLPILYGDRTVCEQGSGCRYGRCGFDITTTPTPVTVTTTAPVSTTTTPVPTTTAQPDCCCENRPLGKVVISMEYVPCTAP